MMMKEEEKQRQETRERKLHEAAMKGTETSLLELLQEDPFILTTSAPYYISVTPLHISAFLGHSAFAKELLSRKPELVRQSNSRGSSPLHIASAKGYVEIVKELMLVNPEMCSVRHFDGRTPLHLGVIRGRVTVLTELIRVKPEAARVLTSGGESCLHLCLKNNRLEGLKVLVKSMDIEKAEEFVNWKDCDGNTVLHVAVVKKQIEVIKFLLTITAIEVNSQNANGYTALDILSQSPRDLRDMEIKEHLRLAIASRIKNTQGISDVSSITQAPAT